MEYRVAPTVQAVLLSYPDINHLGALPYAMNYLGLSCPIYATTPVHTMGQFFLYDAYEVIVRTTAIFAFFLLLFIVHLCYYVDQENIIFLYIYIYILFHPDLRLEETKELSQPSH